MYTMKTTKFKSMLCYLLTIGFLFASCSSDDDTMQDPGDLQQKTFMYEFHNGQAVPSAPYDGIHPDNLMAEMTVEEMDNGQSMISVTVMNTIQGEMYMVHAHDAADPTTTPNGTPYNESPNVNLFVQMAEGNGGDVTVTQTTDMSFTEITEMYEGFFVIHDPLQELNTADVSTYLTVGAFAREQPETNYMSATFNYDFNVGQTDEAFAYSGDHPSTLSAMMKIQELAEGKSRVSVMLENPISGETYMVHAHDFADPSETPNGTPYNEAPNGDVMVLMIEGSSMPMNSQISAMSFNDLTTNYGAFFVIHDPLQPINTADPTTYVALGVFADQS